jgi:hypothetical protein
VRIARNQSQLLDLFDQVFLLQIDGSTQEVRLAVHDALNRQAGAKSADGRSETADTGSRSRC